MLITQEVLNQVHDMLQWDRVLLDADDVLNVPRTCASLMKVCEWLEAKYGKPTELVIVSWEVAKALLDESLSVFMDRDWNFNLEEDQQEFGRLQLFKSESLNDLFEAGYVGTLAGRIPVVASIRCGNSGIATVASVPNQVEVGGKHNTIYIEWV